MENSYPYPPDEYLPLNIPTQDIDAMNFPQNHVMSNPQHQSFDQYQMANMYVPPTTIPENHVPTTHGSYHPSILSQDTFTFVPVPQNRGQNTGDQRGQTYKVEVPGPRGWGGDDMGILNSDIYVFGDGDENKQTETGARPGTVVQPMPFGIQGPSRQNAEETEPLEVEVGNGKRKRKVKHAATMQDEVEPQGEEEDARKKTRGRPRVDTKDETPAERRRTQIRLAQRAYRNRKETTISSLEKRVQDLRGTNEEMSNIFNTLHEFAVNRGILTREPELARQLQSATQRFVSLASSAGNGGSDGEENASGENQKQSSPEQGSDRRKSRHVAAPRQPQQQISPPTSEIAVNPWGGYTLAKAATPSEETELQYRTGQAGRSNVQIITRPTEENASFSFDFMELGQYRAEYPQAEALSHMYTPALNPAPPASFAFTEISFARRLHRDTTEAALRLASLPSPPKAKYRRVFGITAMYESNDAIIARLKRVLAATAQESLQRWEEPFVHLGRAGTFYPTSETDRNSDLMPKFQTGYSMGPFSAEVSAVHDLIQDNMSFSLPGFEGDFFDANDVEGYLRARGVGLSSSVEVFCSEIDLNAFGDVPKRQNSSTESSFSPETPHNSVENIPVNSQNNFNSMSVGFYNSDANLPYDQGYATWDLNAAGIESVISPEFDPGINTNVQPGYQAPTSVFPPKSFVTINIRTFIDGLISRCVCLGRAPGFRPSDVNTALKAAMQLGIPSQSLTH